MTAQEAIAWFLKHNQKYREVVRKIERWNEQASANENVKQCGFNSPMAATTFARRYALEYRRSNTRQPVTPLKLETIMLLRSQGVPDRRIALMYGVSRQAIHAYFSTRKAQQGRR